MVNTSKQFEVGKIYYTTTRKGDLRVFNVTKVFKRKSTSERVLVEGSFDGKPIQKYEIKHTNSGCEYILADSRYATVIAADYTYERGE